mgnify:CR=1 FL=1
MQKYFILGLILLFPLAAAANEPPAKPNRLALRAGLGAPLGLVGLEYGRQVTDQLSLCGGVGMNTKTPQFAGTARFSHGFGRLEAGVGLGMSVGGMQSYEEVTSADPVERGTDLGLFGNAEVFFRWHFSRVFVGLFAGGSRLVVELLEPDDTSWPVQETVFFGGFELGLSF